MEIFNQFLSLDWELEDRELNGESEVITIVMFFNNDKIYNTVNVYIYPKKQEISFISYDSRISMKLSYLTDDSLGFFVDYLLDDIFKR